jgi:hypothetical protein
MRPAPDSPSPDQPQALAARLQAHVARLAGEIGERNVWRPASLHAAADYIPSTWPLLNPSRASRGAIISPSGARDIEP